MEEKKVSVIVPIYNSEEYLPRCIASILGQTYKKLEIILVDDGSKDDSLKVCNEYAERDHRIKVIHQENRGVSAARNQGLDNMSGDCFTFVDSDDELYQNAVEFLVREMIEYDADMVSAVKTLSYPDGTSKSPYDDGKIYVYDGLESIKRSLLYDRQTNSACAKLFAKETFSDVRFAAGHSINEDGYFLFECYAKKPKVVQHNVSIYRYNIRETSNSRFGFSEKFFDMIYFSDLKMQYIQENLPELIELAKDMEVSTHLFFLEVLCRTNDVQYKKDKKNSIRIVRKRFFKYHPINKHERKMAAVVAFGLYPLYKMLFRIKYY